MPPKLMAAQIDGKLNELRQFVQENREILAARRGATLVQSLRKNKSADEHKWYMFLNKKAADFNPDQAEHLKQTFALLGTVSNVPMADASVAACSSSQQQDVSARCPKVAQRDAIRLAIQRPRTHLFWKISKAIKPSVKFTKD